MSTCEFCRNGSGRGDSRGNCISCGAPLPKENGSLLDIGCMSVNEVRAYMGHSGSSLSYPTVSVFMGVPISEIPGTPLEKEWEEYIKKYKNYLYDGKIERFDFYA